MKTKTASILLLVLLLSSAAWAGPAQKTAVDVQKVSGADWLLMSGPERADTLKTCMDFLLKKGIPMKRSAAFYGSQLTMFTDQPGAQKALVVNLLTTIIYKDDARARELIARWRTKPSKTPAKPMKREADRQLL